jgi:hypothetical protein
MTFWKRQSYGDDKKKISGCQVLKGKRDEQVEYRRFLGL